MPFCHRDLISRAADSRQTVGRPRRRCENFLGEKTIEPSVIGWMPSAQLYFRDPDGHSVEFIALLDDTPDPNFIGPLSAWQKKV